MISTKLTNQNAVIYMYLTVIFNPKQRFLTQNFQFWQTGFTVLDWTVRGRPATGQIQARYWTGHQTRLRTGLRTSPHRISNLLKRSVDPCCIILKLSFQQFSKRDFSLDWFGFQRHCVMSFFKMSWMSKNMAQAFWFGELNGLLQASKSEQLL